MVIRAVTRRLMSSTLVAVATVSIVLAASSRASAQANCSAEPLAVQVLGSGGPYVGGTRASMGYLVWRNGRAVVMVDAGGGTFLRFGEAGARLQDLSLLAISHVRPDPKLCDLTVDGDDVAFLWLRPITESERQYAIDHGGRALSDLFTSLDADRAVDERRESLV